jgi:hypothetical protein
MEIVYFVLGVVSAGFTLTAVGMVNVRNKIQKIESNTNDFDNNIVRLIESTEFNMDRRIVDEMREVALRIDETNRSIDNQIHDIQRECDEIRRMIDSRIDKLENKFGKTNKEIIKG